MTEHCDCADLPAYVLPTMSDGVNIQLTVGALWALEWEKKPLGRECWKFYNDNPDH